MPVPTDAFIEAIADAVCKRLRPLIEDSVRPDQRMLLNAKDAAPLIGRTPAAVRAMIARGEIPETVLKRMGRRIFLVRGELERWLMAQ